MNIQFTAGLCWASMSLQTLMFTFEMFRYNTWVLKYTAIPLDIIIFLAHAG